MEEVWFGEFTFLWQESSYKEKASWPLPLWLYNLRPQGQQEVHVPTRAVIV